MGLLTHLPMRLRHDEQSDHAASPRCRSLEERQLVDGLTTESAASRTAMDKASVLALATSQHLLLRFVKWAVAYAALAVPLGGLFRYPWEMPGEALRLSYAAVVAFAEYMARGCRPLLEEWTLPFEIVRAVIRAMAANYSHLTKVPRIAQYMRFQTVVAGTLMAKITCWQHGTKTETFTFIGLEHIWVRIITRRPAETQRRRCVILYVHGGGYAVLSPRFYASSTSDLLVRIHSKLSDNHRASMQVEVLLVDYRKTPEHPYPVPPNDVMALYRYLVDVEGVSPHNILVAGDSAGAGLILTTLIRLRDQRPSDLPCAGILSCPYVDLEMRGDERKAPYCIVADGSVNVVPEMYVPWGGIPETWGDASPLHCRLSGLPQVLIVSAEIDYLLPQAKRLMELQGRDQAQ